MLLMRCAWHPTYRGYPWVYGVGSWHGAGLEFSDGMCGACARRWRAEPHAGRVHPGDRPPALPRIIPAWLPRVGFAIALAATVIFAARPLDNPARPALPSTATWAHLSPEAAPRIEPAAAQTVESSRPTSGPARPRQLTRAPIQRSAVAPGRGGVAHVASRDANTRAVTTCPRRVASPSNPWSDCRPVAVSAKPTPIVVVPAP